MVPIMNSRHCHRRPQSDGLPMNFQYAANPGASIQATYPMTPSFHGLPGSDAELNFMVTPSEAANILSSNYSLATSMSLPQSSTEWTVATQSTSFDDPNHNNVYGYSANTISNDNGRAFLGGLNFGGVPRSWPLPYDPEMLGDNNMTLEGYDPSAYMMDPERYAAQNLSGAGSALDCTTQPSHREFARLSISPPKMEHDTMSPDDATFDKAGTFRMPSSESSEESGSSREATAMEIEDHATDEPYAKLIYRALMSAPNHSMVLQEIYQWFRDNTVKGSSDTKGWMNSIRHNLSMNAAFKKTERKMSGDETKKSTEWVLEDFAIKDGVQSTTRYRKGTGAKKVGKSENPAPSRQSSGRKGGISASKSKLQRQRGKEDRSDLGQAMQRIDSGRRLEFQQHTSSRITQRQRSPPTPPPYPESLASYSPYFMPKQEPFEMPFEDMYRLEDVQGVYIDDGPIFSNHQNSHNPGPYLMNSSHRY